MEIQAVGKAVRKGQTQNINVFVLYIDRTLDNLHKYKHNDKTLITLKLLGDKEKNPMYEDDNGTESMTTEQRQDI